MSEGDEQFLNGVFSTMQYLVLIRGEDQLAKEVANENGIRIEQALKMSKRSGFQVRRMNRFIREELRSSVAAGGEGRK